MMDSSCLIGVRLTRRTLALVSLEGSYIILLCYLSNARCVHGYGKDLEMASIGRYVAFWSNGHLVAGFRLLPGLQCGRSC